MLSKIRGMDRIQQFRSPPRKCPILGGVIVRPLSTQRDERVCYISYVPSSRQSHPQIDIGKHSELRSHTSDSLPAGPSNHRGAPDITTPPAQQVVLEERLSGDELWEDAALVLVA